MLYDSEINSLLDQWTERLNYVTAEQSYKDAVRDCIYDVKSLIHSQDVEEAAAAFEQEIADDYLSTIEAHDKLYYS